MSFLLEDRVFTGDTLLIEGCGRTDFQQGDAGCLFDSIHSQLFTLPDETQVFPGHSYGEARASTIGWEKVHNPRLGNRRSKESFVAIMAALDLPPPNRLGLAVPANLRCGQWLPPDTGPEASAVRREGVLEVAPEDAGPLVDRARVVDVREAHERRGPLGFLPGSESVPLGKLVQSAQQWSTTTPLLLVCRSGKRSAEATRVLARQGFTCLYSLEGGMRRWTQRGLPVQHAALEA
jgi:rhodanese-related sulfurtransferase